MLFNLFITKALAMSNSSGFRQIDAAKGVTQTPSVFAYFIIGVLLLATSSVFAVELQKVDFQSESNGKLQINLQFDGVPPEPVV